MLKRGITYCLLFLLGVFAVWFAGFCLFVRHINSYEVDRETKTDAIIVLTGGRNRISEGIRLLNDNMAQNLFISGVPEDISIHDIEKQAQIKADNEDRIVLGRRATNTIENAEETMEWVKENNIHSIRLVTSSYHIPRSLQEFIVHATLGDGLQVVLNPIYSPNVNRNWWKSWGTFRLLVMEYNKFLLVYIFRHLHIY